MRLHGNIIPLSRESDSGYGRIMLQLADAWVWDSWYAHEGANLHAFYLKASKALVDPELRHSHPIAGHSVSRNGIDWTECPDALALGRTGAFDDQGIWTGSIIEVDGQWHLFYTGICRETMTKVQRIGHAVSEDLSTWRRIDDVPCVSADPRWYQTFERDGEEPWRDPWVFRWNDRWHMLITAKQATGPEGKRGCIAHAVSDDLYTWEVLAPLTSDVGLTQLEVLQVHELDGQWVCVFCLTGTDVRRTGLPQQTGTWTMPCDSPLGPFHVDAAEPIALVGNYAGRIVDVPGKGLSLLAFVDRDGHERFAGAIGNPVELRMTGRGTLQPAEANARDTFLGV